MTSAESRYLDEATEAGLVRETGSRRWVAAAQHDAIRRRDVTFVEYCERLEGITDAELRDLEAAWRSVGAPDAVLEVRARAGTTLPAPWEPWTTYVTAGPAALARYAERRPTDGVELREAGPHDQAAVAELVRRAVVRGYGEGADLDAVDRAVDDVLAGPDRRSWVAVRDGEVVGQVTVFTDDDPVGGVEYDHVLDSFVVDGAPGSVLEDLVARAVAECERPVLASVGAPTPQAAERICASLERKGWVADHVYWVRDA